VNLNELVLCFRVFNPPSYDGITTANMRFAISTAACINVKWLEGDMEAPICDLTDLRFLAESIFSCRIESFSFLGGCIEGASAQPLWRSLLLASQNGCEVVTTATNSSKSDSCSDAGILKSNDYASDSTHRPEQYTPTEIDDKVVEGRSPNPPDEKEEEMQEGAEGLNPDQEVEPTVLTTTLHHLHSARRERMRFSYNGTHVVVQWIRGGSIFPLTRAGDLAAWACRLFEGRLTGHATVCVRHPSAAANMGLAELHSVAAEASGTELFALVEANCTLLIRTMPAPLAEDLAPHLDPVRALDAADSCFGDARQSPGLPAAQTGTVRVWVEEAGGSGRREEVSMTLDDAWASGGNGGNGSGVVTWQRGGVAVAVSTLKDVMVGTRL
jgi:hypothetical protein